MLFNCSLLYRALILASPYSLAEDENICVPSFLDSTLAEMYSTITLYEYKLQLHSCQGSDEAESEKIFLGVQGPPKRNDF